MANALQSAALTAVATLERAFTARTPALADIRNFLFLQHPKALGTAIHATPAFSALRATLPEARIIAAAGGVALDVLRNNPALEALVEIPSPLKDVRAAAKTIRAQNFFHGEPFVAIQTQGNERSLVTLAEMLGGAHRRVGFAILPEFMEAPLASDKSISLIADNLRILTALGHGAAFQQALAADPTIAEPHLYPSDTDRKIAHKLLASQGLDPTKPYAIFITQTFKAQRKSWRPERFRAVAETLARDYGMSIVFAGTAAEAAEIESLRDPLTVPNATIAGHTSILELAAVMQAASICITLDTGPMHIARSVGLPLVVIAPAWSPPIEWLPLNNPRARILKNLDMPEMLPDYIIDEVSVAEVEAAAHSLLSTYPPKS